MTSAQSGERTLRRRFIQAASSSILYLSGCSLTRTDQSPTSAPTGTTSASETRSPSETASPTEPTPSTSDRTEIRSVSSSEYLADVQGDTSRALATMIEEVAADGPARILWDSGTVVAGRTIAPETNGTEISIDGNDELVIDATGMDGNVLDLEAAPNVNIDQMMIKGSPGERAVRSLLPGAGATLRNIILDGGAGGLDVKHSDVTVTNLEAYGHRDLTNGYAAGIHLTGDIENVHISDIDIRDCDRGVEIDDGPRRWTVERGSIRSIDNSQADDPGVPFALDCHAHAGRMSIQDGTFRDILVEDCQRGLTVSEHEEGLVSGITAEDIRVKHVSDGPHIRCEADVELINPTVVTGADNENWAISVRGGSVKVTGGQLFTPSWSALTIGEGGRTPLKGVQLDGLNIVGDADPDSSSSISDSERGGFDP